MWPFTVFHQIQESIYLHFQQLGVAIQQNFPFDGFDPGSLGWKSSTGMQVFDGLLC